MSKGGHPFLGSGAAAALARPLVLLSVEGHLERVLDLLDPGVQAAVGTDGAELVAPYLLAALRGETATQQLGRIAYETGRFEALRGPSAQRAGGHSIAVSPDRVRPPSRLEVYDPDGLLRDRLPR